MAERVSDIIVSYDFLPSIGGAHMWLYEVYRRWPSKVVVFTAHYSATVEDERRQREFDGHEHGSLEVARAARASGNINLLNPAFLAALWSQVGGIRRLAGRSNVRLHALRAFPEGLTAYAYRRLHRSCGLITYAHGEEVLVARTSRQLTAIAKRVYLASDLVIANSESTRRLVLGLCPSARVTCIRPGVDVAAFGRNSAEAKLYRQRWQWAPDTVVICTLGRLEKRKNQGAVIRVIAQLLRDRLPVAYVCAGDGPERPRLQGLAEELGIVSNVRFLGQIPSEEKPLLYLASDVFAMPSVQVGPMLEGFGIVFLEAAAAGIPSICGDVGGQSEAVLDGRTGLVVDGRSLDAIAGALGMLVQHPDLRQRMGAAAQTWAAAHEWSQVARKIESAIVGIQ